MNANDWQAAAEVLGVLLVVLNGLGGMFIYRMQASFVTRAEHNAMGRRIDDSEEKIEFMDKAMSKLVTTEEISGIYNRLNSVENKLAHASGQLDGIAEQITGTNRMLEMLVRNELEGGRRA